MIRLKKNAQQKIKKSVLLKTKKNALQKIRKNAKQKLKTRKNLVALLRKKQLKIKNTEISVFFLWIFMNVTG